MPNFCVIMRFSEPGREGSVAVASTLGFGTRPAGALAERPAALVATPASNQRGDIVGFIVLPASPVIALNLVPVGVLLKN